MCVCLHVCEYIHYNLNHMLHFYHHDISIIIIKTSISIPIISSLRLLLTPDQPPPSLCENRGCDDWPAGVSRLPAGVHTSFKYNVVTVLFLSLG